ncbi:DUF3658 domain-containing protein [Mesorhizobium sp. AR07]|nr:DUF3658 domain-containing protein [Mesorhizobium sp. AR07]
MLVSAPAHIFDELLLERAAKDWRKVARVIAETMGHNMDPYIQVGDLMLLTRIVALVDQGATKLAVRHGLDISMDRCVPGLKCWADGSQKRCSGSRWWWGCRKCMVDRHHRRPG